MASEADVPFKTHKVPEFRSEGQAMFPGERNPLFNAFCDFQNLQGDGQFAIGVVLFSRTFMFQHMFWNFYSYRKIRGDRDWIKWYWRMIK